MLNIMLWKLIYWVLRVTIIICLSQRRRKVVGRTLRGDGNCTLRLWVGLFKEKISLQIHGVIMRSENLQNSWQIPQLLKAVGGNLFCPLHKNNRKLSYFDLPFPVNRKFISRPTALRNLYCCRCYTVFWRKLLPHFSSSALKTKSIFHS